MYITCYVNNDDPGNGKCHHADSLPKEIIAYVREQVESALADASFPLFRGEVLIDVQIYPWCPCRSEIKKHSDVSLLDQILLATRHESLTIRQIAERLGVGYAMVKREVRANLERFYSSSGRHLNCWTELQPISVLGAAK